MAKDLFSNQHALYARHRPTYPKALYSYILSFVNEENTAWDCATGNGQAAIALAEHFKSILATDISEKQLSNASPHEKIKYLVSPAEQTPFQDNHFDLITVAQAYHWFDFNEFNNEALRVGKNGGVIAVWGYNLLTTHHAETDNVINTFYAKTVGPYWDPERKYLEDHYKSIPFGFPLLPEKKFAIEVNWKRDDLVGYLTSWSAVQHYITANNSNPIDLIIDELSHYWKENETKAITFPLFLKMGRIEK